MKLLLLQAKSKQKLLKLTPPEEQQKHKSHHLLHQWTWILQ
jgi:hypothetical protein